MSVACAKRARMQNVQVLACAVRACMHVPSYGYSYECICNLHTRLYEHAYFTHNYARACMSHRSFRLRRQAHMEREPASDIITGVGSRRPRIDATNWHKKRKRRQNTRIALLGGTARRTQRSRRTRRTRPMKRSELMVAAPMVKKKPKPRTIAKLKPKIMPKPRPRPARPMGPTQKDALPAVPEVIDLTVDPMDLTGV